MVMREMWAYLAGDPCNHEFNRALNKAIFNREIIGRDVGALLIFSHPEDWEQGLTTVCYPRAPIALLRRRYVCREPGYDWPANVPKGFSVEWVDVALLDEPAMVVPEDVMKLLKTRGPGGDPMQKGFGFVAVHEGKIAAHAVIDCIVDGIGDIGLATGEEYRRRGLATVTAAAAVEYGLTHGLELVNWDCAHTNTGSVRTAEKLGFQHVDDHMMYLFAFD